ncbi:MAG: carbohydrate binding domain-containing protein [Akkermansiaceae bacterium]|nr:carbohydrate binding domain-containing protein [Armatimonadota bacterium]
MRIVLKPAGLMFILGGFLLLIVALVWRDRSPSVPPSRQMAAAASLATSPTATVPPSQSPVSAPVKTALPPGVLLMPDITSNEWLTLLTPATTGNKGADAILSTVNASVPGHPWARHISIRSVSDKAWEVQIARPLSVPLRKGKRIRLTFWGRSKDSCPVSAVVEQNADPYTKVVYHVQNLTPEWKQYTEEWTQPLDAPANWAKMDFHLGHKVGEVELTGVIIRQAGGASKTEVSNHL